MNGWYVEVLLLNREIIKFNIEESYPELIGKKSRNINPDEFRYDDIYEFDFLYNGLLLENDVYNDLLDIERVYNRLFRDNTFTRDEIESLKYMLSQKYNTSKLPFSLERTMFKNFKSLCSKIAYFLGGRFTDEGYIEYLREKYDLDYEQIIKLNDYIKSKYRLREVILG